MEKKTIGQFIAALRKANGLTQQEVADRLNVSNKAVSRWERDECAPDISVIPALAELLGVTCDELLKGERITNAAQAEKSEPKVEKQVKALINRTLSGFKTLIWISIAVAVVGLVCMFGISYGFYRPVIGFAVMLLFEACAFVIAVLAVSRTKDVKTDNELFENADEILKKRFNLCLGNYSFWAFLVILIGACVALPIVLVGGKIPFEGYLMMLLGNLLLFLFCYLKAKGPYIAWITEEKQGVEEIQDGGALQGIGKQGSASLRRMNFLQIGAVILATIVFLICPYFEPNPELTLISVPYIVLSVVSVLCLVANVIIFVIFAVREKNDRKNLCVTGVRNMFFIPFALICREAHYVVWSSVWGSESIRVDGYIWLGIMWLLFVVVVFGFIERRMRKNV